MNWKIIIQKIFKKIGFEIHRTESGKEYILCPPYGYSTYSPWFEDKFQEIYRKINNYTIVKEDRCYIIQKFCYNCLHLEGEFAECGVYKGGTAFLTAYTLKKNSIQDKELHLFDTFTGMPDTVRDWEKVPLAAVMLPSRRVSAILPSNFSTADRDRKSVV